MVYYTVRFFKSTAVAALFVLLASCSPKAGDGSRIVIRLPGGTNSASSKVGSLSFDINKACFAINVTASDISSSSGSACEIPLGKSAGFAPSGGEISIEDVPKGSNRKLEMFVFQRTNATDTCPSLKAAFTQANSSKTARVAEMYFDIRDPVTNLTVVIDPPPAGVNVATQYSLPGTCVATDSPAPPASGGAGISSGSARISGPGMVIDGSIGTSKEMVLTGTGMTMQLTRKAK